MYYFSVNILFPCPWSVHSNFSTWPLILNIYTGTNSLTIRLSDNCCNVIFLYGIPNVKKKNHFQFLSNNVHIIVVLKYDLWENLILYIVGFIRYRRAYKFWIRSWLFITNYFWNMSNGYLLNSTVFREYGLFGNVPRTKTWF